MSSTPFEFDETFDVVIVGAGPAGCVLANRLSNGRDLQVLLIEAGPDPVVPGFEHADVLHPFAPMVSSNAALHWPGLVAETGALPSNGGPRRTNSYIQGYGVGGASNINGMAADRGQPGDYDEWRDRGAENWGWDNVLPYFKKLEQDLAFLTEALGTVARARGMSQIAQDSGLSRESLYKSLSAEGNPEFATVCALFRL